MVEEVTSLKEVVVKLKGQAQGAEAQAREAEVQARESEAWTIDNYRKPDAFEADASKDGVELYLMVFESCKRAVADSFSNLDLWVILPPGEEEEEEEGEGAKEGEAASMKAPVLSTIEETEPSIEDALPDAEVGEAALTRASMLPTIEETEPTIGDALLDAEEAEVATKTTLLAEARVVALAEVPSLSWALEPEDDTVGVGKAQVVSESGP